MRLADEYVSRYFQRSPEAATRRGLPADNGGVVDNSLAAVADWRLREDGWLRELRQVDTTALAGGPAWAIYGILRELLEDSVATRVCRNELWSLNTNIAGWQSQYTSLLALQPVGTDLLRAQAIARVRALPRFLRTEQTNLREGIRRGYVAPRTTVEAIVRQLDGLLATPADSSPFASPAARDSSPAFRAAYLRAVAEELLPAITTYRRFLVSDYLPHARAAIGVSANPDGMACYEASVRRFSTLTIGPGEVYRAGEQQLARSEEEMRVLGERTLGTGDVPALLRRLREDTAWTFRTRREILDRSNEAVARAKAAAPRWFGRVPTADVVIREYPEFRQRAGAVPSYSPASEDGSRPGIFSITTWQPERISRASLENAAFHEAIPGHHLQNAIAQERREAHPDHPVLQLLWLQRRLGVVRGAAGRRDGSLLGGRGPDGHARGRKLARGATGRRRRHPHQGLDPAAGGGFPHRTQRSLAVGRRGGGGSLHLVAGAGYGVHAGEPHDPRHSPRRRGTPGAEVRYPGVPRRGARRWNHHAADAAGADGAVGGGAPWSAGPDVDDSYSPPVLALREADSPSDAPQNPRSSRVSVPRRHKYSLRFGCQLPTHAHHAVSHCMPSRLKCESHHPHPRGARQPVGGAG